jgi:hypothetical protein
LHLLIIECFEHPVFIIALNGRRDWLRSEARLQQLVLDGIPAFERGGVAEHLFVLFIQVLLIHFLFSIRFQRNVILRGRGKLLEPQLVL